MINNIVHITSKNTATFTCPRCNKQKVVNVSKFIQFKKKVIVNVKCPCGTEHRSVLNKRKQYRKKVNLRGTFSNITKKGDKYIGRMKVCDISRTGMKLKLDENQNLSLGDILKVEFFLDDEHQSFIQKRVLIRSINLPYIGTEFESAENIGKAIGFYLYFD